MTRARDLSQITSTGVVNLGSGQVYKDASGNVGIGTSSPSARLHVDRAGNGHAATFYSNSDGVTAGFHGYGITLTGNLSSGAAETNIVYGAAGGGLAFNGWNGTTQTERMRINSAGNVGIGTAYPRAKLDISNPIVGSTQTTGLHLGYSEGDFYGYRVVNENNPSQAAAGNFKIQKGTTAQWLDHLVIAENGQQHSPVVGFGGVYPEFKCRAWVNFNGSTLAIRASGNVSSVTRIGTGDFQVNFSTAMPDLNFSAVVTATGVVATSHVVPFLGSPGSNDTGYAPSTASLRFSHYSTTSSGSRGDPIVVCVQVFR